MKDHAHRLLHSIPRLAESDAVTALWVVTKEGFIGPVTAARFDAKSLFLQLKHPDGNRWACIDTDAVRSIEAVISEPVCSEMGLEPNLQALMMYLDRQARRA